MNLRAFLTAPLRRLGRDRRGVAAVEFGLLGAFMVAVLLGVVQIGLSMQRYNALRSIADDTARYTMVEYQAGNELTEAQIRAYARSTAQAVPYFIESEGLLITVSRQATKRVEGTTEFDFTIRAQVSMVTGVLGFESFYIYYSRAIFVIDE